MSIRRFVPFGPTGSWFPAGAHGTPRTALALVCLFLPGPTAFTGGPGTSSSAPTATVPIASAQEACSASAAVLSTLAADLQDDPDVAALLSILEASDRPDRELLR